MKQSGSSIFYKHNMIVYLKLQFYSIIVITYMNNLFSVINYGVLRICNGLKQIRRVRLESYSNYPNNIGFYLQSVLLNLR